MIISFWIKGGLLGLESTKEKSISELTISNLNRLRKFLRDYLPPEKIPRSIAVSTGPVRDDAGKVRKKAVAEHYTDSKISSRPR